MGDDPSALKFNRGCALSMPVAIVGRFVTGTGGAGMMDLVSILLNKMTSASEVGLLRGYVSLGITLGVSCGPPLGGVLTDAVGWRWYTYLEG
jgi:MFS family permease